jgi:hypothetical protein
MLRELTTREYESTMAQPMRRVESGESQPLSPGLASYVRRCFLDNLLPISDGTFAIRHVYESPDQHYEHVLFDWGRPDAFLVVVMVIPERRVIGHHFLDLGRKYGIGGGG